MPRGMVRRVSPRLMLLDKPSALQLRIPLSPFESCTYEHLQPSSCAAIVKEEHRKRKREHVRWWVVTAFVAMLIFLWLRATHPATRPSISSARIPPNAHLDPPLLPHPPPYHPLRLALVINLARRQDRWRRIAAHLAINTGLQKYVIERIDAVDGHRTVDFAKMVADGRLRQRAFESIMISKHQRVWGQELTPGAVGCLLSHAKAWERAAHLNESILVLEDDVELVSPAFEDVFPRVLQELPTNFGLLYLGDMARDFITIRKSTFSPHLDRLSRPLWGTYAYVLSPRAARRLLLHMYPADVQVDSYIRQVAELYERDMPNFVVAAQDLVYTDNSEARDTDAQAAGGAHRQDDGHLSSAESTLLAPMRYHALLPFGRITFDPSLDVSSSSRDVQSHTEADAVRHALEIGLMSRAQARALAAAARRDDGGNATRARAAAAAADSWRWLLCLATAMRLSGGLCFSESFVVVRSIAHLVQGAQVGIFMSNSPRGGTADGEEDAAAKNVAANIMPQVVYVSPLLRDVAARRVAAHLRAAFVSRYYLAAERDDAASTFVRLMHALAELELVYDADAIPNSGSSSSSSRLVTTFPPHVFSPLPLQRPCHCDSRGGRDARVYLHEEMTACQSRCDRLVPPYAGGYHVDRTRAHTPTSTLRLHMSTLWWPSSLHSVKATNASLVVVPDEWKRLHPRWDTSTLPLRLAPSRGPGVAEALEDLRMFCAGLSAVAKYGGAYVDARVLPRRALLQGILAEWAGTARAREALSEAVSVDAFSPAVVMLWRKQAKDAVVARALYPSPDSSATELSWRFVAAPFPNHPVATRLARACPRIADNMEEEYGKKAPPHSRGDARGIARARRLASLQLQQVLADDAWSVQFFAEEAAFASDLEPTGKVHGRAAN